MEEASVISRACDLFRENIPEIASGVIEIKRMAWMQEAGICVAVRSCDPKVDAVSACVRPPRPSDIARALAQGPLRVVRWSEDIRDFIAAAMPYPRALQNERLNSPSVRLRDESREAAIIVDPVVAQAFTAKDQLDLELASKLVGWKLTLVTV
jgi:N utilization substance protein A